MKRPNVSPNVGPLAQMVLAVWTLKSLWRPTLVSKMSDHVTPVFVATIAIRTRVSIQ